MKLRINGNSLRLRLSRSEVARFGAQGLVEEAVEFGADNKLIYILAVSPQADNISVAYQNGRIEVWVPRHLAEEFTETDRTGISGEQAAGSGPSLQVLVEKDFKCIHGTERENSDAYPNPLAPELR